jgi:hypothetical protein
VSYIKAVPNIPAALVIQAGELHVPVPDDESVDFVFSTTYSAMKATDRISNSRNNTKKTKSTLDGFRIEVSAPSRPKGKLAISVLS